jgi:hypothetical protein
VGKGKKNPLTPMVDAIQLWPADDEKPAQQEPQPGSTERFISQFGPAMDRR